MGVLHGAEICKALFPNVFLVEKILQKKKKKERKDSLQFVGYDMTADILLAQKKYMFNPDYPNPDQPSVRVIRGSFRGTNETTLLIILHIILL